jgi:hypothetical protein
LFSIKVELMTKYDEEEWNLSWKSKCSFGEGRKRQYR